jgi:hypothetical protein
MARTSQTLTQNQTPSARRKVAQRSPTRLMSQKKSRVLRDFTRNNPRYYTGPMHLEAVGPR